jgi:perosamine synthetase
MSAGPVPLARPSIGDGEIAAAERALRSGRLTLGPETERFERRLAELCGRRHAIAVASGTAALDLCFRALEIAPGDEVLVPAFGFPAAANLLAARGAAPIPVDVVSGDFALDLERAAEAAGPATRLVVSIDPFGLVCEADPLAALATRLGAPLLSDAACGLGGADSAGVPGGGAGLLATLSFHPRKVITTGEGGAVLTDDDRLAAVIRELRNHGQAAPGRFARPGTNARLSEVSAAVGCAQLERLDPMLAERRLLADGYCQRLAPAAELGKIRLQEVRPGSMHAYQTFALLLAAGCDRDRVRRELAAAGVESGPATYAFPRLESFAAHPRRPHPVADALHERSLAGALCAALEVPAGATEAG